VSNITEVNIVNKFWEIRIMKTQWVVVLYKDNREVGRETFTGQIEQQNNAAKVATKWAGRADSWHFRVERSPKP